MNDSVDLFVIGGGSGGVRAARIAASHGATVAIAEEHRYGGTCVIRGCIPKKFFVYASNFSRAIADGAGYGWTLSGSFDWQTLVANKDARIDRLNSIYIGLLEKHGVEIHNGRATILSANEVEVAGKKILAKNILVATGGHPTRLDIPGAELGISSNEIFYLKNLPKRLAIVGAGYIGIEFASIFAGLGVETTLIHHRNAVLRGFDEEIREQVAHNLKEQGIRLLLETQVTSIERLDSGSLRYQCKDGQSHEADEFMFATGRTPHTKELGLEAVGVKMGSRGGIDVDAFGKTSVNSIYAVGDCLDGMQLTPVAIRQGHAVADNLFAKEIPQRSIDQANVPTAVFCSPTAATCGLSEGDARAKSPIRVFRSSFKPLFHSMTGREEKVLMKIVVDADTDKVLGVHMVGDHADEIIQTAAIAMTAGATKADFDRTVALHPCSAEELVLMKTES